MQDRRELQPWISARDLKNFDLFDPIDQENVLTEARAKRDNTELGLLAYESDIVGIAIADLNGVITEANNKCLHYAKKTRKDLAAGNVSRVDFATDEINETSAAIIQQVYEGKRRLLYKKPVEFDNGSSVVLLIEVRILAALGKTVTYIVEETASTAIHDLVREERVNFEQLANSVPCFIWTALAHGEIDYYNNRWYEMLQLERSIFKEDLLMMAVVPDERSKIQELWRTAVKTCSQLEAEIRIAMPDGTVRWHMARAIPSLDPLGKPLRWYGTCLDVHDQKSARLRAEFSEYQFNSLLDSLPIVAWGCTIDGVCNLSKGRALRETGIKDNDLVGMDIFAYTSQDTDLRSYINAALRGEILSRCNHFSKTDTWYESVYSPTRNEQGEVMGMIAISIDITDSKNKEQAARNEENARNALKIHSSWVSAISHEIRGPLAGILGMSDLILLDTISEIHRPYLKLLKQSGETLLHLVNEILDLSKLDAGKMTLECLEFDMRNIVNTVAHTCQVSLANRPVRLYLNIDPLLPRALKGDPTKIQQLVTNLTTNALKFTSEGSVIVQILVESITPSSVNISLSVIDTGPGLSDEFKANLFQEYAQQDSSIYRRFGGTGLGLSICQKLVTLLGGTMDVESELGRGSIFRIRTPLLKCLDPQNNKHERESSHGELDVKSMNLSLFKVLVAEDNAVNQIIIERMLKRLGIDFTVVSDGEEVLVEVTQNQYDLILMDNHMERMDGITATKILRSMSEFQNVIIVALTAGAMEENRLSCLRAGMDDFLTKPISFRALGETLKKWQNHSRQSKLPVRSER